MNRRNFLRAALSIIPAIPFLGSIKIGSNDVSYAQKILEAEPDNLIGYWLLSNELSEQLPDDDDEGEFNNGWYCHI